MPKFEKGNPGGRGRLRGSRNKASLIREAISQADGLGVVRAMVRKARGGDVPAAKLVLPLICPAGSFVKLDLPPVNDAAGIAKAQAQVLAAAGNEQLSLEEAGRYSDLIENRRRALETVEIERKLRETQDNLAEREQAEKARRR
jgi:hypothetical protein